MKSSTPRPCRCVTYDRCTWKDAGSRSALDRARDQVRQALANHQPRELDPAMEQELDQMRQMIARRPLDDFYLYEMEERQDWDNL